MHGTDAGTFESDLPTFLSLSIERQMTFKNAYIITQFITIYTINIVLECHVSHYGTNIQIRNHCVPINYAYEILKYLQVCNFPKQKKGRAMQLNISINIWQT